MTSKPRSALLAAQCLILLAVAACSQEPVAPSPSADGARAPFEPPTSSPVEPSPVPEDPDPVVEGDIAETGSPGTDAAVFISFGGYSSSAGVEVAGYVADRVEAGGTCVLTLTEGRQALSVSAAAIPDARTTVCGTLTVPGEQVPAGTWEAVLSYRSAHAAGSSEPLQVEVP